jgi:hypothetical protein
VGHYVSLLDGTVEVLRYDASASVAETYSLRSVQENLRKFHTYLEGSEPRAEMSVVSHAIRVFRQLRSASDDEDGTQSLLSFLTDVTQFCSESGYAHASKSADRRKNRCRLWFGVFKPPSGFDTLPA